jgi:hypothetical protein
MATHDGSGAAQVVAAVVLATDAAEVEGVGEAEDVAAVGVAPTIVVAGVWVAVVADVLVGEVGVAIGGWAARCLDRL